MTSGSLSLPSKQVLAVDAEEINNLSAKFIYNFFTSDEGINDSGNYDDLTTTADDSFNANADIRFLNETIEGTTINPRAKIENKIKRFIPRYVKLKWSSPTYTGRRETLPANYLVDNKDKILKEENFWGTNFSNVLFQDVNADKKTSFFIERILQAIQSSNVNANGIDTAGFINTETSSEVTSDFLKNATVEFSGNGYIFSKNNSDEILKQLTKVATSVTIANKFIYSLGKTILKNTNTVFSDEIEPMLDNFLTKQNSANSSTVLSREEYDIVLDESLGTNLTQYTPTTERVRIGTIEETRIAPYTPQVLRVGYLIEKTEFPSVGAPIVKDSIILQGDRIIEAKDSAVKYGTKYGYRIRNIVRAKILIEDNDQTTNNFYEMTFLFASKASEFVMIDTNEFIAPPEIADFKIGWDYTNNAARLTWSFPINPQRDIKYFQIFRRSSINEPFELIKMYDFNDSLLPIPLLETPDSILIEKLTSPKSYYLDKEFKKDSKYIYSICAVDAHGYSSNYSIQFECYFDKYANKMIIKPISLVGCPKAYPNANLIKDTFVDSIKDSGHQKINIIFNPEYLEVNDIRGNPLKVLRYAKNEGDPETKTDSYYKFQLINTDLQTQEVITIKLFDEIITR